MMVMIMVEITKMLMVAVAASRKLVVERSPRHRLVFMSLPLHAVVSGFFLAQFVIRRFAVCLTLAPRCGEYAFFTFPTAACARRWVRVVHRAAVTANLPRTAGAACLV